MKKGKIRIKILPKEAKNSWVTGKNTKACARARTRNYNLKMPFVVDLSYIFECDWLIDPSDNKLSNNKLSNNKLVENRTFFNQSQARKL